MGRLEAAKERLPDDDSLTAHQNGNVLSSTSSNAC